MFQKYNLVCRAVIDEAPEFIKRDFEVSCKGNIYATTLHTGVKPEADEAD